MDTNQTTEDVIADATSEAEGGDTGVETVSVAKADYDKLNQTLGSLKRELKDFKKSKEDTSTAQTKPAENALLQKSFLRAAGIADAEEVELALSTAKKWGVEVDALVDDEDFKTKLDKLRTNKQNAVATSNVRGSKGQQSAKDDPAYWIAKGTPPSREDVPDRKQRLKIAKAMMGSGDDGKVFYND